MDMTDGGERKQLPNKFPVLSTELCNPTQHGVGAFRKWMLDTATLPTGAKTYDPTHGVLSIPVEQVDQSYIRPCLGKGIGFEGYAASTADSLRSNHGTG
jgi:hypothetical protein